MSAWDDAIERFSVYLKARDRSVRTLAAYSRDLIAMSRWMIDQRVATPLAVDRDDVRMYLAAMARRGLAVSSRRRALACMRSFFKHLQDIGVATGNPALQVRGPAAPRRLPKTVLTRAQVDRMIKRAGQPLRRKPGRRGPSPLPEWQRIRDVAVIELLYGCGLRVAELVSLDINDIEAHDAGFDLHVTGKRDIERLLPLGGKALSSIEQWLEYRFRPNTAQRGESALFVSKTGRRLSVRDVQRRVAHSAERAHLPGVHPHALRHSIGTHLLEASGDLRSVQAFLGHTNIASTAIYTHLNAAHLKRVHAESHPRGRNASASVSPVTKPERKNK